MNIQATLSGDSLIEVAIHRIQEHEPPGGYAVGFSGGKDSIVVLDLVKRADVKYVAQFKPSGVDPPEVLKFIKEHYPDVGWVKPKKNMFQLIRTKGMLPTRFIRFCCAGIKEFDVDGTGKIVLTGIRWAESVRRRKRTYFEESMRTKNKWFLHPVIEWSDADVWSYIRTHNLRYCSLYDEGYSRIGCIMCPLQGERGMRADAARYPKYCAAYKRAVQYCIDKGIGPISRGGVGKTADEVMEWWISGNISGDRKNALEG